MEAVEKVKNLDLLGELPDPGREISGRGRFAILREGRDADQEANCEYARADPPSFHRYLLPRRGVNPYTVDRGGKVSIFYRDSDPFPRNFFEERG
jgi:hypothetical protein